jgi:transposase-like protein
MAVIANEVKKEIVEKVKQGEPVVTLADQYGVSDRSIYAWLKRKASGNISVLEHNKLKRENTLLKEIIGGLTIELEKTKKKTRVK